MLGNFSFGDYFKDEAIAFAWELLTDRDEGVRPRPGAPLGDRLHRRRRGRRASGSAISRRTRILRFGESENFWAMGDTGPCGPCSEIHYFPGEDLSRNTAELVNGPGDENVEVWNLVFMQFERDASGKMSPLPKPSVDTGMGLERLTAVLQGVNNNFDTDLFRGIIQDLEDEVRRAGGDARYRGNMAVEDAPFRVVADHARAATMLIHDHAMPSNEGRGYVLRRIIRRALRYGAQLGIREPFLYRLSTRVIANYSGDLLRQGEVPARQAHDRGDSPARRRAIPEDAFAGRRPRRRSDRGAAPAGEKVLAGETVFRLYDTHGIPLEVIEEIALDEGLAVDRKGFEREPGGAARPLQGLGEVRGGGRFRLREARPCPRSTRSFAATPSSTSAGSRARRSSASSRTARRRRQLAGRRDRRGRDGPDGLLSRRRGPGRRHRDMALGGRRGAGRRHAEARSGRDRPPRHGRVGSPRGRHEGGHGGPGVGAAAHAGQPHRHAPAPRRAAEGARRVGPADGISRRAGPAALRLRGLVGPDAGADRRDRAARQRGDPARPRGHQGAHDDGRVAGARRHRLLRGEVRREGARRGRPRLLHRALRRLPRAAHRRDRRLQDRLGPGARGGSAPARGGDVARSGGPASTRRGDPERALRRRPDSEGEARRAVAGARGARPDPRARARRRSR